jgi:hypothetical protein
LTGHTDGGVVWYIFTPSPRLSAKLGRASSTPSP